MSANRLSARARELLAIWPEAPATVRQIAIFAAQNPGFDPRNYGDAASYRADSRKAQKALARVRLALYKCAAHGVTDADIYTAQRGDRLTASMDDCDYTACQYWCVEFRDACARVLESAARLAYQRNVAANAARVAAAG